MDNIYNILQYALISTFGIIVGCLIALFREPGDKLRNILLHFAAGVIISVVAVEILPQIVKIHDPINITIGFSLGVLTMMLVKYFTEKFEDKKTQTQKRGKMPWAMLIAGGVDEFLDGLLLGIGFIAGQKEGILLSIGLAIEVFIFSLAMTASLRNDGISKKQSFIAMASMAILFLLGVVLGTTFLSSLSPKILEVILSFGLAALLYLVTEELLTEAYEIKESPWMSGFFFLGFLLFLILGIVM
ncbi:ZIP family metal transporter [Flavobacterium sp.]|uniref:ZIP family metal transporter n=1 Tax=Flavobacterium sp. TaxID=239 RepID=UPI0026008CE8|nr:ZIP family metal transporter [Flavobacterium sp.]